MVDMLLDYDMFSGVPIRVLDDKYFIVRYDIKQRRCHHKKRINKKWKKRYGFTCKPIYDLHKAWGINGVIYTSQAMLNELNKLSEAKL